MAKCRNCGNWMPDNALICNVCNTPAGSAPAYQQPQYPNQSNPTGQAAGGNQGGVQPVHNTWTIPKTGSAPGPAPAEPPVPPQPPIEEEPVQKKKGKGKKILLFSLLGVLVVGLIVLAVVLFTGGNGDSEKDQPMDAKTEAVLGFYEVVSCTVDGEAVEVSDEYVELKKNGRATLYLDGESFTAQWELNKKKITFLQEEDEFTGTLEDGLLTLDLDGMVYEFLHEDAIQEEPASPEETGAPEEEPGSDPTKPPENGPSSKPTVPPSVIPAPEIGNPKEGVEYSHEWWAGDWYGWWIIVDGTGKCEQLEGNFWDVCATFSVEPDGTGYVSMWDQDESSTQSRWEVDVVFQDGKDDRGVLVSQGGSFWNSNLLWDDWYVDPCEKPYDSYTMLHITGHWEDRYDERNTCTYYVFLRPWGISWEDLRTSVPSSMPYDDMMPALYDDWYLPLIQAGEDMPSRFPA